MKHSLFSKTTLAMVVLSAATLAACGNQSSQTPASGSSAPAATASAAGTLDRISSSGVVNLGVRESSGLGFSIGNKYVGFHTEMAERIVDDLSKQLGKPLTINYQVITSQNRIPLISNGTVDFECGSTTNNVARQKDVGFAMTTFMEETRIAVRANSGINSIEDLNGKTVATTTGSTPVQLLRQLKQSKNLNFTEVLGKDMAESFLLLESGKADAFVMDASILATNISRSRNPQEFKIVEGEPLAVEPIACMIAKDDAAFKEAVDNSIKRQIADGSLEALYNKWFMQPIPPNNITLNLPLSESTKAAWADPNTKPAEEYKQ